MPAVVRPSDLRPGARVPWLVELGQLPTHPRDDALEMRHHTDAGDHSKGEPEDGFHSRSPQVTGGDSIVSRYSIAEERPGGQFWSAGSLGWAPLRVVGAGEQAAGAGANGQGGGQRHQHDDAHP